MTTIAFIGDSHFCEDSRFEECCRLHDWIAEDLERRRVDAVVHSGDVLDRRSTPLERLAISWWLRRLATRAPVLLVRGNHDPEGDLPLFARLRTEHPILVEEACGVHVLAGVAVAAVAWPRKAQLLAALGQPVSHADASALASEHLSSIFQGLGAELAQHEGPRVLAAHAMVCGSVTSHGQPLVGGDMEVGIGDLALAGADFVALGHIHKAQEWRHGRTPIVYTGSPRRTAFGEVEEKGYVLATFDGVELVSWERVVVPATPMILLEDTWGRRESYGGDGFSDDRAYGWTGPPPEAIDFAGAEVRFRYNVDSDQRLIAGKAADEVEAELRRQGAVSVKLEPVVIAQPRAPERVVPAVAAAQSLPEQLDAYWTVRRPELAPARRDRLKNRLTTLSNGRGGG